MICDSSGGLVPTIDGTLMKVARPKAIRDLVDPEASVRWIAGWLAGWMQLYTHMLADFQDGSRNPGVPEP